MEIQKYLTELSWLWSAETVQIIRLTGIRASTFLNGCLPFMASAQYVPLVMLHAGSMLSGTVCKYCIQMLTFVHSAGSSLGTERSGCVIIVAHFYCATYIRGTGRG